MNVPWGAAGRAGLATANAAKAGVYGGSVFSLGRIVPRIARAEEGGGEPRSRGDPGRTKRVDWDRDSARRRVRHPQGPRHGARGWVFLRDECKTLFLRERRPVLISGRSQYKYLYKLEAGSVVYARWKVVRMTDLIGSRRRDKSAAEQKGQQPL